MKNPGRRSKKAAVALLTCICMVFLSLPLPLQGGSSAYDAAGGIRFGVTGAQAEGTAHEHRYKETVYREADCKLPGLKKLQCPCGDIQWVMIPPAHTPGEVTAKTEPTCTQPGVGILTCAVCGAEMDTMYVIPPQRPCTGRGHHHDRAYLHRIRPSPNNLQRLR